MSSSAEDNANSKIYSQEALFELTAQNPDRYYLSIHENVYDVTEFLDEVNKNKNFISKIIILILFYLSTQEAKKP